MSGPWEAYGAAPATAPKGPWEQYGGATAQPAAAPEASAPTAPGMVDKVNDFLQGVHRMTPSGMAAEGMGHLSHALEQGAYDVGGKVTDATGSPALGYASNVGLQAIPALAGGGIGKAATPLLERAGERVMRSALKPPSSAVQSGEAAKAIRTMLDEGVNATPGGAVKLRNEISASNKTADSIIEKSTGYVPRATAETEAAAIREKFAKQVTPENDLASIDAVIKEFSRRHAPDLDIQRANEIKKGTYKVLEGKYGEQGSAATETQKALARGLRKGIEADEPSVAPVNARTRELIRALDLVEPRAAMAGNRDIAGLSLLAANPKTSALMMADRSQLFKSLLARGLYNTNPTYGGAAAGSTYGLNTGTQ